MWLNTNSLKIIGKITMSNIREKHKTKVFWEGSNQLRQVIVKREWSSKENRMNNIFNYYVNLGTKIKRISISNTI